MTPFLPIVILNGRKNALWEKWETGQWHGVKNLWLWWRLTVFLITAIDSSLSLWMTPYHFPHHGSKFFAAAHTRTLNISRHSDSFLQSSFWTVARMLFKKNGKRDSDTEWRIYYFEWHLTAFLTTVTNPSRSLRMTFNVSLTTTANPLLLFRMTPNGNHMLRLLTHS